MGETENIAAEPEEQRKRKGREVSAARMQLNLTSMIDVIFQLLIYFVVTASFSPDEGIITTKLPALEGQSKSTTPELPKNPINIQVSTSGQYGYRLQIDGWPQAPADFTMLADMLARNQYNNTNPTGRFKDDTPVNIKPDETVRWQHVVNAFNAAIKARYKNVTFARVKQQE